MSYQDNLVQSAINNYMLKNRASFEATKDTFLNNSFIYIDDDGEGLVALQTKTLWTNPSPSSSFAAQDVTVNDLSDYDYFVIISNDSTSGGYQLTNIQKVLDRSVGTIENWNIINNSSYFRSFEQNQNTLKFKDNRILNNSSGDNSVNIPYQIIGIKLVNSQAEVTNVYSTDETVVGRWIDGKKIYRKVINYNMTTTSASIDLSSYNIDTMISQTGFNIQTSGNVTNIPIYVEANDYVFTFYRSTTNVFELRCGNTTYGLFKIIIEYTKTTD